MESQKPDLRENKQTQRPEPKPTPSTSRLIRQPNIQVPEILVTVELDPDIPSVSSAVTASSSKVCYFSKTGFHAFLFCLKELLLFYSIILTRGTLTVSLFLSKG